MSYWVAGATVVGGVVSATSSSKSAKNARNAATGASDATLAEDQRQFDLVRGDTAGARFIGNGATNTLARLYGYGSMPAGYGSSAAAPATYQPGAVASNGGIVDKLHPWMGVTSKLGTVGKIVDPAVLFGSVFGSKHGDEKRNLDAFLKDNQVVDLGNGTLQLQDGTQFQAGQLKDIAGTYYGAKYAPDGNQADWQQRYSTLLGGLPKAAQAPSQPGVPGATSAGTGQPDMSAFFESPDYQFNLAEGQKAIDRSLAARGGALSGGGVREGIRYASGKASGEFGSFVDRLMQQAGLGNTGIGASAAAGANYAGINANSRANAAATTGSAYIQQGQGINNAVQGGISNLLLAKYLNG